MNNQNLNKWLNAKQLREYLGGISQATLWRYYKRENKLPQPKRISKSILLWNIDEVNAKLGLTSQAEATQGGENE
ncbi:MULTISPECIES: helix-turn-helix transcriptional regulator [unclassified Campylobacter]|uniref:helix-turn-helix transcriptional regulator n=1 Tax=unclassified Campylobacter TaxID=2593542 RepID=UPI0022E9C042|nr:MULTISPECIES: hypothetical protein [unclassified Campylobacter]MDA3079337.1 hypothetical protein [Campylobacter sp. CS_NA2]MDA3081230.1 hypothetical protein [Campylobacter sp. CS_NA1]MDA3085780.1 hypothetical protein [Campylobacter sp. CS_ED1]MDA3090171.1 hypothetical protein [Campylobacter sp. CS_ED2]WBR51043.1 hypothetical protein PF026_06740 [Campylobacter sp. CS_NA3]